MRYYYAYFVRTSVYTDGKYGAANGYDYGYFTFGWPLLRSTSDTGIRILSQDSPGPFGRVNRIMTFLIWLRQTHGTQHILKCYEKKKTEYFIRRKDMCQYCPGHQVA